MSLSEGVGTWPARPGGNCHVRSVAARGHSVTPKGRAEGGSEDNEGFKATRGTTRDQNDQRTKTNVGGGSRNAAKIVSTRGP